MHLSDRIKAIEASKSIQLAATVNELRKEGKKIISMNVGEPDFPTPLPIIDATKLALDKNETRYSLVPGIEKLRTEIAKKLAKENNIYISEDEIIVSNGSKQILYNIFQTIINPGDEVIIPIPYWVSFPESVKLAGGQPIFVETKNHQLDLQNIENSITKKTKAIIINTPNNPSGAVFPEADLKELANIAIKNNILIISDEAYEHITYNNIKHVSIASLSQEIFNQTITVQTFSKSFCMTGFRIGFMVAPLNIVNSVNKLQSHLTGNNCTFGQFGAIEALRMDPNILSSMIKSYEKRKHLAFKLCSEIFECINPDGAFYLFPNVEKYLGEKFKTDEDLAMYILQEAHVAVLPGSAFGSPGHLRFSFSTSEEDIIAGFEAIKRIL